MNELTLKLKNELIRKLTNNEQNLDEVYLHKGTKSYSRRDLANEVENETEFGISLLTDVLMLSLDLTTRIK